MELDLIMKRKPSPSPWHIFQVFAEQYNMGKEEVAPIIEEEVNRYYNYLISESIQGYTNIRKVKNNINIDSEKWNYTLLPAWILTYKYKGKTYVLL